MLLSFPFSFFFFFSIIWGRLVLVRKKKEKNRQWNDVCYAPGLGQQLWATWQRTFMKAFWSLREKKKKKKVQPVVAPQCVDFTHFKGSRRRSSLCGFLLLCSLSSWWFLCNLFNRALFLQCSHVTPMQSPYVLNSDVVSCRRLLRRSLCLADSAKMTLQ